MSSVQCLLSYIHESGQPLQSSMLAMHCLRFLGARNKFSGSTLLTCVLVVSMQASNVGMAITARYVKCGNEYTPVDVY